MKFPDTLPDDDERIIHCREEGCIGKYAPPRIERFAEAGILHADARGPRLYLSIIDISRPLPKKTGMKFDLNFHFCLLA